MRTFASMVPIGIVTIFAAIDGATFQTQTIEFIYVTHTAFSSRAHDKGWSYLSHRATELIRPARPCFTIRPSTTCKNSDCQKSDLPLDRSAHILSTPCQ